MLHKATITAVQDGIVSTYQVEDTELMNYYAKITGAVAGICGAGSVVSTSKNTSKPRKRGVVSDPYAKVKP
jgi:hypothetical protein